MYVSCQLIAVRTGRVMVQVRVTEGVLEGELVDNEYGGQYYSFKGIPFAQPPLGDLRFKAPQPAKPWTGVRSANQFGPRCYQLDMYTKKILGNEDCLYLNVYSPDITPNKPLPVMVWIHGGAFFCGSGEDDFYGPQFLIRKDVVVVTINYRLEVFGFLCLNTPEIPGNAGMKDQVAALRWVKDNIANFGGDPNNVTIFGESAGGASVSYHTISPLSKGLFKRAIAQSGAPSCYWATADNARERALRLARQLGCYSEDNQELYEFFKKQPAEDYIQVQLQIYLSEMGKAGTEIYLTVADEKDIGGDGRFFYGDLTDAMLNNVHEDIEIMAGFTTDEGLIGLGSKELVTQKLKLGKDFPDMFVSRPLQVKLPNHKLLEVGKKLRQYYFKDQISTEDWENLSRFAGFDMFVFQIMRYIKLSSRKNKVYAYLFSCKSERNVISHVFELGDVIKDKPVTCHADDTLYLFHPKIMNTVVDTNSEAFRLIEKVTDLWTNFAKYGNPTPDSSFGVTWKPYTSEGQDYLDIGNVLVPGTTPFDDELKFWENIYTEYGERLYQ